MAAFAATALLAASANGQPRSWPEPIANRLEELSHRFIHCSAMFSVAAFRIGNSGDPSQTETIQRYIRYSNLLHDKASTISVQIDQRAEVVKEQWEASAKELLAEMHDRHDDFACAHRVMATTCSD